ncbi:MAG: multiubiquitin domain-containing protein [Candidatus Aenigmarchaeota archaeon]|nr:multiubiquitin domain-containing protein [Candidatus Aenigmarchaeota archaeon]
MEVAAKKDQKAGKKFFVNIEGKEYPWERETITTQEIRILGDLPAELPVIQESPDGTERTLAEDEVIVIQPGHRHGRASKYKRG